MNPKEIAEAIDELIQLRIRVQVHSYHPDPDKAEMLKREIADGIRKYSEVKGVAVDNQRDAVYHHPPKLPLAMNPYIVTDPAVGSGWEWKSGFEL